MYRGAGRTLEVLLVHPGGPFWRNKDEGAWSIPKGEIYAGEDPKDVARREFMEELGSAPAGPLLPLGEIRRAAASVFTRSPRKATWMSAPLQATPSKSNGRPKADGFRRFRRSTARSGSRCGPRAEKSLKANCPCSTGWKNCADDRPV
jgi:predicted NUDIX family NTP pyrophosphohydrolase